MQWTAAWNGGFSTGDPEVCIATRFSPRLWLQAVNVLSQKRSGNIRSSPG